MRVGVPGEIKKNEHRVGLTPTAVREYVAHGHEVKIQEGAGLGAGFSDDDYRKAGATLSASSAEIFAGSDMIVKVKEPQPQEVAMLDDAALLPGLLTGLEAYVPKLEVKKVPNATHWIVHEQPILVASEIERFLSKQ